MSSLVHIPIGGQNVFSPEVSKRETSFKLLPSVFPFQKSSDPLLFSSVSVILLLWLCFAPSSHHDCALFLTSITMKNLRCRLPSQDAPVLPRLEMPPLCTSPVEPPLTLPHQWTNSSSTGPCWYFNASCGFMTASCSCQLLRPVCKFTALDFPSSSLLRINLLAYCHFKSFITPGLISIRRTLNWRIDI